MIHRTSRTTFDRRFHKYVDQVKNGGKFKPLATYLKQIMKKPTIIGSLSSKTFIDLSKLLNAYRIAKNSPHYLIASRFMRFIEGLQEQKRYLKIIRNVIYIPALKSAVPVQWMHKTEKVVGRSTPSDLILMKLAHEYDPFVFDLVEHFCKDKTKFSQGIFYDAFLHSCRRGNTKLAIWLATTFLTKDQEALLDGYECARSYDHVWTAALLRRAVYNKLKLELHPYKEDTTGEGAYQEVIQNWAHLKVNPLQGFKPEKGEIEALTKAVENCDWKNALFDKKERFPKLALIALRNKMLSKWQFSTVCKYYGLLKKNNKEDIQFYSAFDSKAQPFLVYTKKVASHWMESKQWFGLLKRRLGSLPPSESGFFVVKCKYNYQKTATIRSEVNKKKGNALNFAYVKGKVWAITASLGLQQTLADVWFGSDSVRIKPVLGVSLFEHILKNGEEDSRDMALSFPGMTLEKNADGISCPTEDEFTLHDWFHVMAASSQPKNFRVKWMKMVKLLEKRMDQEQNKKSTVYKLLKSMNNFLVDMPLFIKSKTREGRRDRSVQLLFQKYGLVHWAAYEVGLYNPKPPDIDSSMYLIQRDVWPSLLQVLRQ